MNKSRFCGEGAEEPIKKRTPLWLWRRCPPRGWVGLAGLLSGPQGFSGAFRGLGVVFRGSLGQGVLKGSLGPMGFSGVLQRFSRGLQRLSGGSEDLYSYPE